MDRNMANKKTLAYIGIILFVLLMIAVPLYLKKDNESVTYSKSLMGTVVQITLIETIFQ